MRRVTQLIATMLLGLLLTAGAASADTTIDTTPQWNGEDFVFPFGYPDTSTYGQVITAPANDTQLDSFTFLMNMPDTVTFRGEVYAWDGTKATGPNLYESAPRTTTGSGSFEEITFNTGGVQLVAGQKYVLFATISKDPEASSDTGIWGFIYNGDPYVGGMFVFMNNAFSFDNLLTSSWNIDWGYGILADLAFKAVFSRPQYAFSGFFTPVNNPPTINVVKAGSGVPVKFSLGADEGLDIFAGGYPVSRRISCASLAPQDGIEQTVNAGQSSLSYDSTTERYTYAWMTREAWSGTCRQLVMKLDDGSIHRASFKFR